MTDDLDTLRPEVADAVSALDETTCMTNPGLKWYATIRAELLRLAGEVTELRAVCAATYQAAGCYGLPERFKDALSNAATGERIHDVDVDKLCPVDPVEWVERAEKAEAELAEMKQTFDLRWKADTRAIDQWRAAHPNKELVMPDHADLCMWLMGELAALRELHKVTCESAAANARELAALKARIAGSHLVIADGHCGILWPVGQAAFDQPKGKCVRLLVDEPAPPMEPGSLDELRIERGGGNHG